MVYGVRCSICSFIKMLTIPYHEEVHKTDTSTLPRCHINHRHMVHFTQPVVESVAD